MEKQAPNSDLQDSWRPEDKAMESAEEEVLEIRFPEEIQRRRALRHAHTPALRGFEHLPPPHSQDSLPGDERENSRLAPSPREKGVPGL